MTRMTTHDRYNHEKSLQMSLNNEIKGTLGSSKNTFSKIFWWHTDTQVTAKICGTQFFLGYFLDTFNTYELRQLSYENDHHMAFGAAALPMLKTFSHTTHKCDRMKLTQTCRFKRENAFGRKTCLKPKKLALLGGKTSGDDNENLFLSNCLENSTCGTFA